ncbi:NAD(P)/FAD-dependent oxidoreductase [Homoserinibacter sp. GY 40078]|uniref:NAD(P)/FAD-dependent oxidoreductase n=1 Tax=Homoserinibacter sp. GY 40078 TaxID=2603275 RepID=UPI0011C8E36C|nr:NAD(P)/FAD-dependent oxidoreductase [Homoserinibacter sp. GY 40078]TXK19675.1 NAD(P)/FAD-dependent oxidoreductase [Homoserinibacter sp. GY 40078]
MTASSPAAPVDVAIVGGGPAGLSAAIALGRSRRPVVVIDAGEPRNAPAAHAHNVFSRDGAAPFELLADSREQARGYGVQLLDDRVAQVARDEDGFTLRTAGGGVVRARRLLLASGLRDVLPDIAGIAHHWGDSVIHCPYCHGWEVRDRAVIVIGTGPHSARQALMFSRLSADVTFIRHDAPVDPELDAAIAALGVRIIEGRVAEARDDTDGTLAAVVLDDGQVIPSGAIAIGPRYEARTELFEQLGGVPEVVPGAGTVIPTDAVGRTPLPDVWAVGNASDATAMVGASAAAGTMAGAQLNVDLLLKEAADARAGAGVA